MAAELILLIIVDAAIEVKIRVYLQQEEMELELEGQFDKKEQSFIYCSVLFAFKVTA